MLYYTNAASWRLGLFQYAWDISGIRDFHPVVLQIETQLDGIKYLQCQQVHRHAPVNKRLWLYAGSLLSLRRRRWPNDKPALNQNLVFTGAD